MLPGRTDRKDEAEPQTLTQRLGALLAARPRTPPRAPRGQESPRIEYLGEVESLRANVARMREQLAQTQRADAAPGAKANRRDAEAAGVKTASPAYVSQMVREALEQHLAADVTSARRCAQPSACTAAKLPTADLAADEDEEFSAAEPQDEAQPCRKRKRGTQEVEPCASGSGMPPNMRIRIGAERPSPIPDIITPEAHRVMAWLGATGSIRSAGPSRLGLPS